MKTILTEPTHGEISIVELDHVTPVANQLFHVTQSRQGQPRCIAMTGEELTNVAKAWLAFYGVKIQEGGCQVNQTKGRGLVCCFCGEGWGYEGEQPTEALLKEAVDHEAKCPKNPYLSELTNLREQVNAAAEAFTRIRELAGAGPNDPMPAEHYVSLALQQKDADAAVLREALSAIKEVMTYQEFLHEVIEGGIAGARRSYSKPSQATMLEGSIEGFEACRTKTPDLLSVLLEEANQRVTMNFGEPDYWRHACFRAEVEWTCNCVSALLANDGLPVIVPPTARGVMLAHDILRNTS